MTLFSPSGPPLSMIVSAFTAPTIDPTRREMRRERLECFPRVDDQVERMLRERQIGAPATGTLLPVIDLTTGTRSCRPGEPC